MCVGIILKNGSHLQSIKEIEDHFNCTLYPYKDKNYGKLLRHACTCQIDLNRFMNEPCRKDLFEYDYVEYWEK